MQNHYGIVSKSKFWNQNMLFWNLRHPALNHSLHLMARTNPRPKYEHWWVGPLAEQTTSGHKNHHTLGGPLLHSRLSFKIKIMPSTIEILPGMSPATIGRTISPCYAVVIVPIITFNLAPLSEVMQLNFVLSHCYFRLIKRTLKQTRKAQSESRKYVHGSLHIFRQEQASGSSGKLCQPL